MAYSVSGNTTPTIVKHRDYYEASWTIVELDVATTSEYTISLASLRAIGGNADLFTMALVLCTLTTAGTSATVRPKFGRATGWSTATNDHIAQATAAAVHHHIVTGTRFRMPQGSNTIYCRSTPNAGTAGRVDTEISIRIGAE